METASTTYRVHQCSKCQGNKKYYCKSCPCDLCPKCKDNHVKDLQTIDHDVGSYRDEINYFHMQEICLRHPSHVYKKYCEPCELPVCFYCTQHKEHRTLDIRTFYKTKRQQHRETIHTIRSEALFYRPVFLPKIKDDFKICYTNFSLYQSEMLRKAKRLKHLINKVKRDFMNNVLCEFDFKHRCLKQKIKMSRHIVSLQRYIHRYEQQAYPFSALQFLSTIKTALSKIHLTLHTSQFSMNESFNKEDVMESLSAIKITERGNRNQCLLKLMSDVEIHKSLTETGVGRCLHISSVTSDRFWVSDGNNIILINTRGVSLHHVKDLHIEFFKGFHTVNSESELIYIDRNYNINKLSKDMKTTTTIIERTDSSWEPQCVYWSPSTGDLLVGMYRKKPKTGGLIRYSQSGQLSQTIQQDNKGRRLYSEPCYITENNNGDVVVSDFIDGSGAVVVTEREGRHRFSYRGHPIESGLKSRGICTDALSHILVCDDLTKAVQMINKDGQFLFHLLIRPSGIILPWGLSYDVKTHRLLVGSWYNDTIVIYRYITRPDALTDLNPATADVMESLSEIPTPETEKPQQGNQCQLKLINPPESLHSITLTSVDCCYHISCATSDRVWVSDGNNLIFTNPTCIPLHRVEDSCGGIDKGLHTVNSESELIYIDRNFNINKLSTDMKTTTTFIERTDSTWEPQCVYWSPSTGDLLVGMCKLVTGKVIRYNQSGQQTQTIHQDNTGLGLYSVPLYITENNNGDVVVSDSIQLFGAVVVTERGGRHRFSYTGHPPETKLLPRGICTDTLSHILVCDGTTKTVQILDMDGQFLSHLLIKRPGVFLPWSLSYEVKTRRLLVGSWHNNTMDALTDLDLVNPRKQMNSPESLNSLTLTDVGWCHHISCVTSDRVWVSDGNNIILKNPTGIHLHCVKDSCVGIDKGLHTVNSESELIYIDRNYNINKLSTDMKTTTTIIERTDSSWEPQCVYWSPSTGDLLVGMCKQLVTGKVIRYNQSGQQTQTIHQDNTGLGLYSKPLYITENNNGDVVVSDPIQLFGAVVVTESGGRYRFSYTGHPSESTLVPLGICTDALSHILVCDNTTETVHILDMDGQFLSRLRIRPFGIFLPWSLSYDFNTRRLLVGLCYNDTMVIYRYITKPDALTYLNPITTGVMESLSEFPTPETEKLQQKIENLRKQRDSPGLLPSFTLSLTGVDCCYHISCATSDRVWVSDGNNLIFTNTTSIPLHRVEDSYGGIDKGLHTVNSESELIYIDRNYNINKLSTDMKTTTTFIKRTDSLWEPQCVYWSLSTGDLLVGMGKLVTGKVIRYNQSGQQTQTIHQDNTGLGLYSGPLYITENNNGDVVVSDSIHVSGAVVVTERGGRHRFSYTGHPIGSILRPRAICTDALSHILVCDDITKTVQILDMDGQFLSHLLTKSQYMYMDFPQSLSYDDNTDRLWVGSSYKKMVIYRYITRQDALTDKHPPCPVGDAMLSSKPAV